MLDRCGRVVLTFASDRNQFVSFDRDGHILPVNYPWKAKVWESKVEAEEYAERHSGQFYMEYITVEIHRDQAIRL